MMQRDEWRFQAVSTGPRFPSRLSARWRSSSTEIRELRQPIMPSNDTWSRRAVFFGLMAGCLLLPSSACAEPALTACLIGYTEPRTNLPGGRHANVRTMRAVVVKPDGTGRRVLGEELTRQPDTWTQFAGWSPDGRTA